MAALAPAPHRVSLHRSLVAPLVALALSVPLAACAGSGGEAPGPFRPSIVLITCEGLRFDAVAALAAAAGDGDGGNDPGTTPNLDALVRDASWAGSGIASSGWAAPAGASLLTGLQPWKHQVLHPGQADLAPELETLAEVLADLGYSTSGYWSGASLRPDRGYGQGFDELRQSGRGAPAMAQLRALRGQGELVWLHFHEPSPPWVRRDWLLPQRRPPANLPTRLGYRDLERYRHPAVRLPPGREEAVRELYRHSVAWVDERIGRALEALTDSGHGDEVVVVVTSTNGLALGEDGQVLDGFDLSRHVLEVPVIVRLPAQLERSLAVPEGRRVATSRIFATLVQAAGGEPAPAVAASLFQPADDVILSELYHAGHENHFSLLTGDRQLLWRTPFAAAVRPGMRRPAVQRRLDEAFAGTLPLTGRADGTLHPRRQLWRWSDAGVAGVDDAAETRRLVKLLHRRWTAQLERETTPREAGWAFVAPVAPRP